jgi:hypothetical protein
MTVHFKGRFGKRVQLAATGGVDCCGQFVGLSVDQLPAEATTDMHHYHKL